MLIFFFIAKKQRKVQKILNGHKEASEVIGTSFNDKVCMVFYLYNSLTVY